MHLDKFTDYGLRILMTLAVHDPKRQSVAAIAGMFDVSENHLSKVATELVRAGFCISERGRSGGLRLARASDQIGIGDVVRSLKRDTPLAECFGPNNSCCIVPGCGLRHPLKIAEDAFFLALDGFTLADVTAQKSTLQALLSDA